MITAPITLSLNNAYHVESGSKELVAGWILTMMIDLGGHKEFMDDRRMSYDELITFFGLSEYEEEYEKEDRGIILDALIALKKEIDAINPKQSSPVLEKNIQKLCAIIKLSSIEIDVLRFCMYLHYYDILEVAGRLLNDLTTEKFEYVLAVILKHPRESIREVFSSRGTLAKNGLLMIDRNGSRALRNKVDISSNGFADKMMSSDDEIEEMIRDIVKKCSETSLLMNDFGYLEQQLEVMVPYMRNAIEEKRSGVNILLYGRPGTGKTEFVKAVAKALQTPLYEVSYEDDDGDPIEGVRRLKAFRTAQSLFSHKKVLLMFDEIEDVINSESEGLFGERKRQTTKGWINRMLETNPIPTIWITNNVRAMDRAVVRRFDVAMEMPIPPKSKRKEILKAYTDGVVDDETIASIAENEGIAPAVVARAAKVIESVKEHTKDSSASYKMLIDHTLKAQGMRGVSSGNVSNLPVTYDPSYVNTAMDLKQLLEGIRESQSARICLYGVPGTGKSAFGQWIARELEKPFLLKKGSDLISMWVGGTEKNIAAAFKEAKEEGAVLVFDEVDSFLQDRRMAKASWEVTQVNEMLVQMENYDGIFIATTNLMDGLDQASIRRFDLKLEFGYLKHEQAVKLFKKEAESMGVKRIEKTVLEDVARLNRLAPGDFAAVRRQSRFAPIKNAKELYERLCGEVTIKHQESGNKMGFLR